MNYKKSPQIITENTLTELFLLPARKVTKDSDHLAMPTVYDQPSWQDSSSEILAISALLISREHFSQKRLFNS